MESRGCCEPGCRGAAAARHVNHRSPPLNGRVQQDITQATKQDTRSHSTVLRMNKLNRHSFRKKKKKHNNQHTLSVRVARDAISSALTFVPSSTVFFSLCSIHEHLINKDTIGTFKPTYVLIGRFFIKLQLEHIRHC